MKIKYAIHSSDSNPFYLDFWPIVSKIWKLKFDIEPVLLYVDDNHEIQIDETHGTVIKFKQIDGIPLDLQCLWIRYWWPSQVPDDVCIISDIDMLPVSKFYFIDQITNFSDEKYIHLNPLPNYFPSCYHVAKGRLFKNVLKLHDKWDDSIQFINNLNIGYTHSFQTGKVSSKWGSDESYATESIQKYEDKDIFVFIPRTHGRIDRSRWEWTESMILNDIVADSHSIRPYNDIDNKPKIDKLTDVILENSSNIKILMLIVSCNTLPVYKEHRKVWETYMNNSANIDCYFLINTPDIDKITIIGNTCYIPGKEVGITTNDCHPKKTIDALEYFLSLKKYDFVVRTNTSSIWNFKALNKFIKTLPCKGCFCGIPVGNNSCSGAGMILSNDVCVNLLENKDKVYATYTSYEDISLSLAITNATLIHGHRTDVSSVSHFESIKDSLDTDNIYHYRCKIIHGVRDDEPIIIQKVINNFTRSQNIIPRSKIVKQNVLTKILNIRI